VIFYSYIIDKKITNLIIDFIVIFTDLLIINKYCYTFKKKIYFNFFIIVISSWFVSTKTLYIWWRNVYFNFL